MINRFLKLTIYAACFPISLSWMMVGFFIRLAFSPVVYIFNLYDKSDDVEDLVDWMMKDFDNAINLPYNIFNLFKLK